MKPLVLESPEELTYHQRALTAAKEHFKTHPYFTADHLRTYVGEPSSSGETGAFFQSHAFRAIAEPTGFTISEHSGNPIFTWGIKQDVDMEEL